MVRLVFRPYTQVRRSICTLESLRASTRVSPGFALLRHSSPSFGSQHVCSHSNLFPEEAWSVGGAPDRDPTSARPEDKPLLSFRAGGSTPRALAHMLDSLVRVSRRVVEKHFVRDLPRLLTSPDTESIARQGQRFPRCRTSNKATAASWPLSRATEPTRTWPHHFSKPARGLANGCSPTLLHYASISAISGTF